MTKGEKKKGVSRKKPVPGPQTPIVELQKKAQRWLEALAAFTSFLLGVMMPVQAIPAYLQYPIFAAALCVFAFAAGRLWHDILPDWASPVADVFSRKSIHITLGVIAIVFVAAAIVLGLNIDANKKGEQHAKQEFGKLLITEPWEPEGPLTAVNLFGIRIAEMPRTYIELCNGGGLYVEKALRGEIIFSMDLKDRDGRLLLRVVKNEWWIVSQNVAKFNHREDAVEIVDLMGRIAVQMSARSGELTILGAHALQGENCINGHGAPTSEMFLYPADKHPGELRLGRSSNALTGF